MVEDEIEIQSTGNPYSAAMESLMLAAVGSKHPGLVPGHGPSISVLFLMKSGAVVPLAAEPADPRDPASVRLRARGVISARAHEIVAAATSEVFSETGNPALEISLHVKGGQFTRARVRLPLVLRRFPIRHLKVNGPATVLPGVASLFARPDMSKHPRARMAQSTSAAEPPLAVPPAPGRLELARRLRELGLWRDLSSEVVQANIEAVARGNIHGVRRWPKRSDSMRTARGWPKTASRTWKSSNRR